MVGTDNLRQKHFSNCIIILRYIHGTEPTSHYLALDPSYKNPADTAETNGLMVTIDSTAEWNSDMERTELIPQTTQNLGTGNLFYHFSLSTDPTGLNAPDVGVTFLCFVSTHLSCTLFSLP